jgi:hypothetical protein
MCCERAMIVQIKWCSECLIKECNASITKFRNGMPIFWMYMYQHFETPPIMPGEMTNKWKQYRLMTIK